jgi:hypothetical protein
MYSYETAEYFVAQSFWNVEYSFRDVQYSDLLETQVIGNHSFIEHHHRCSYT